MSSVFMFGAGASHGSGECNPKPPPLGRELFLELRKVGGIAASIHPPLSDIFVEDFESGMAEFFKKRNVETSAFLREMASYFVQFDPGPSNLYRQLLDHIVKARTRAVFATTNYDLLIELSINGAGYKISYTGFPVAKDNFPVLKIHGSCNFLPDLAPQQFQGIRFDVSAGGSILDASIRPVSPGEVLQFCEREDSIAPALAMYAKGKKVLYGYRFVDDQQKSWTSEVRKAKRIFVVGLRANPEDSHIWRPLASSKSPLAYVGKEGSQFREWAKNVRRKNANAIGETFADAIPYIRNKLRYV